MYVMELADLERRRAMTDEERMKEDKELGKFDKDKTNWKFLQVFNALLYTILYIYIYRHLIDEYFVFS